MLLGVNAAGLLVASIYAAAGLRAAGRPGRRSTSRKAFWAAASAVRTWSVAGPLLVGLVRSRPSPALLAVAGLVQLGDAAIGCRRRVPGMATAPAIMGIVHLATARSALRGSVVA